MCICFFCFVFLLSFLDFRGLLLKPLHLRLIVSRINSLVFFIQNNRLIIHLMISK